MRDGTAEAEGRAAGIDYRPSADHPGWFLWRMVDADRFNPLFGDVLVRTDPEGQARVRMVPARHMTNMRDDVHGGALLGFLDIALFAGAHQLGSPTAHGAITVNLQVQFLGGGRTGEPLDALMEIVQETGNFIFLRGLMVQQDHRVLNFSGMIKKVRLPA